MKLLLKGDKHCAWEYNYKTVVRLEGGGSCLKVLIESIKSDYLTQNKEI